MRTFSEILISWEVDDTDRVGDEELDFHTAVLQKFIRSYRHESRDVSVAMPDRLLRDVPIRMVALAAYSDAELQMAPKERLLKPRALRFGIKQVSLAEFLRYLPKIDPRSESNTRAIEERLKAETPFDERHEDLLRAFEGLDIHENPKWALLDVFMAAELAIAQFVNRAKIEKGVSRTKLENFRRDIGVGYMINVDLPLLLSPLSVQERKVIEDVDVVRRKRNDVVHEGAAVSKDDALYAINAANHLFDLLKQRTAGTEPADPGEPQTPGI